MKILQIYEKLFVCAANYLRVLTSTMVKLLNQQDWQMQHGNTIEDRFKRLGLFQNYALKLFGLNRELLLWYKHHVMPLFPVKYYAHVGSAIILKTIFAGKMTCC